MNETCRFVQYTSATLFAIITGDADLCRSTGGKGIAMSIKTDIRDKPTAPDLLTLEQLISLTGWGRTAIYGRARRDGLPFPVLRVGARYYVSRAAYERWLAGEQPAKGARDTA